MEHVSFFISKVEGKEIPSHQTAESLLSVHSLVDFPPKTQPSPCCSWPLKLLCKCSQDLHVNIISDLPLEVQKN